MPSQMVTVSEKAWRAEGSRMFIDPKKAVSVDELLHGEIVQSGNDAAIALAEAVAGSEEGVRRAHEPGSGRLGMKNTTIRQRDRPAIAAAGIDRGRSGAPRHGDHPRFSRVLSAVLAQGVSLQQHHAVESQPPAMDRPVRRRREDGLHRSGRLLPDRVGEARPAAAAVGGARRGIRRGAGQRIAEAPELRIPVL